MKAKNINVESKDNILLKSKKGSEVDLKEDVILKGKEIKTDEG